jgi:hypothetical protein
VSCERSEPIRFVCDCGTESKRSFLNEEITEYQSELGDTDLDFLIVSHLHADHANGLDALLKGVSAVDYVFLPYLTPLQRFVIGLRFSRQAASYYELLADPVGFFSQRRVRRIVFVTGDPPDGEELPQEPPFDGEPPSDDAPRVDGRSMESTHKPGDFQSAPSGTGGAAGSSPVAGSTASAEVQYKTHRKRLRVGACWQVKFFNYDGFPPSVFAYHTLADLQPSAADLPEHERWKKFYRAVLAQTRLTQVDPAALLQILRNDAGRKALEGCYALIAKDHNNVSLTAWHGPARRLRTLVACSSWDALRPPPPRRLYCETGSFESNGGTFLTGDISLKFDLPELLRHYAGLIEETAMIQLPHHGARKSWNAKILESLTADPNFFVSAGIRSQYRHPHLEVLSDLHYRHPWHFSHEYCPVHIRVEASSCSWSFLTA